MLALYRLLGYGPGGEGDKGEAAVGGRVVGVAHDLGAGERAVGGEEGAEVVVGGRGGDARNVQRDLLAFVWLVGCVIITGYGGCGIVVETTSSSSISINISISSSVIISIVNVMVMTGTIVVAVPSRRDHIRHDTLIYRRPGSSPQPHF
jgi:hypothetical protein